MKKYTAGLSCLLVFILCLFAVPPAFAHFPASDGDMTVTLHVDPNDDPVPEKQAHLYFLFDDATNRFKIENCTCAISIAELGKQTYKTQLFDDKNKKPSIWGTSMPYIFPDRNVYKIVLIGNPKTLNAFQPFTITWYFRVDSVNPGIVQVKQGPPDIVVLVSALGAVVVGLVLFGIFIKKEFTTA